MVDCSIVVAIGKDVAQWYDHGIYEDRLGSTTRQSQDIQPHGTDFIEFAARENFVVHLFIPS
jgi:hypothetical protein